MKSRLPFLVLAGLLVLLLAQSALGVIDPKLFRRRASEVLEVKVEQVERGKGTRVRIRAQVTAVEQTAVGVSVGDSILIRYEWDPAAIERRRAQRGRPRPRGQMLHEPEPPEAGATITVYLAAVGKAKAGKGTVLTFKPAAHQYSFGGSDVLE